MRSRTVEEEFSQDNQDIARMCQEVRYRLSLSLRKRAQDAGIEDGQNRSIARRARLTEGTVQNAMYGHRMVRMSALVMIADALGCDLEIQLKTRGVKGEVKKKLENVKRERESKEERGKTEKHGPEEKGRVNKGKKDPNQKATWARKFDDEEGVLD